jgi:hypothetical protein
MQPLPQRYPVAAPAGPFVARRPSYFERHWKWLVPVGCLGMLLLAGLFVTAVAAIAMGLVRSSDAYREAVETARDSGAVRSALGVPIETGWLIGGSVSVSGPSGSADISIPLSGPRASGKLYAVATKSAGRWHFSTLQVEVDGRSSRIDLLSSP